MSLQDTGPLPKVTHGANFSRGIYTDIRDDVVVGDDVKIAPFVTLYPGTRLGDRVEFDEYSNSSGCVIVSNDCKIKKTAIVGQGSILEEKVWIGPFAILIHELHAHWHQAREHESQGCYIHAGAVVGAHACIVAGVTIGYNAEIGCGAVVTKDVPPNEIWAGVPAKTIGEVPEERRAVRWDSEGPSVNLMFSAKRLERYLPHLTRVGRYSV